MKKLRFHEVNHIVSKYLEDHNYSERTIRDLGYQLTRFNRYLVEKDITDFREVREKDYYGFMKYLKKKSKVGIHNVALNSYRGVLKKTFNILEKEEKILINPFGDCGYLKTSVDLTDKVFSEKEIAELLNNIDLSNPRDFRIRTILEVLYGTGIRGGELCNLELRDFVIAEKMLFIRQGKGKKDRIVPLGHNTFECLLKYVNKIRPKFLKNGRRMKYLFFNMDCKKLTGFTLRRIINQLRKDLNIERRIYPHMFRHTFATHLLRGGADLREIQILLGHACISSTEIYLSLGNKHLKESYEKYHPLENELFFDVYGRECHIFADDFPVGVHIFRKRKIPGI